MKKGMAFVAAVMLLLGASSAMAAGDAIIVFQLELGPVCHATGGNDLVTFIDNGTDTTTASGMFGIVCSVGTVPVVTVDGNGSGPGYDFSGTMATSDGLDFVDFTGVFTDTPVGLGNSVPIYWTFDATATGLLGAGSGSYSASLTFTVNP